MALVIALVMCMAMAIPAMAASITINRDDSYDGTGNGNTYKYYKVFSASYESNSSTGGGSTAGVPGDVTASAENASYTATADVAAKLGRWVAATGTPGQDGYVAAHWEKASGNEWFVLTPISGSDPQTYNVAWDEEADDDADAVQAAAAWLIENEAYESGPTALSFANGKWTAGTIDPGYYLVEGATGKNLVAATSDITINEKNTYPGDDKQQKDADDGEDFTDDDVNVAVGDVINYTVTVTIPATAKVGDKILVWDKASQGLSYVANSVTVSSNAGNATVGDPAAADVDSSWDWSKLITVTEGSVGKTVVFSFNMTVTSDAITDTEKKNESGLKYGHDDGTGNIPWTYESTPDEVEYKTYFAGIHKIDGTTEEDLEGVKFNLFEDGEAFNVTLSDGVYIPGGTSNEVVTDGDGLIRIRGLDSNEKTYTLTETETLDGYNMLDEDVTLTLHLDSVTTVTYTPADTYDGTASYYEKDGNEYVPATVEEADFEAGKYYTKTEATSTFGSADEDTWDEVENNKGSVLPSTGGIGTTIFYVIGAILVLGAGILLVTRRRMNAN